MLVGYVRTLKRGAGEGPQLRALRTRGCERLFRDGGSGLRSGRKGLDRALDGLRPGDALVVCDLGRIGRSLPHLVALATELRRRGCHLISLADRIDTTAPAGPEAFRVFEALNTFERDLVERRRPAAAVPRKAGRPSTVFSDPEKVALAKRLLADRSLTRGAVASRLGVSRVTLYRWFPHGDPDLYDGVRRERGSQGKLA